MGNRIHSTAILSGNINLGDNIEIGPYCVIQGNIDIGNNAHIYSHVNIAGNVKIGNECQIFPFAAIGLPPQSYEETDDRSQVLIGNKNIIRESVTISGGSIKENLITQIGDECLLMAYSHVAHDCILQNNIILANNVALAGHVKIDSYSIIGGNSAIHQFTRIGKNVMIGGCSGLNRDMMPFTLYMSHHHAGDSVMHAGIMGVNIVGLKRSGTKKTDIMSLARFYNNFLHHSNNEHECNFSIIDKYNKYEYLIENANQKEIIKEFIDVKSHQGFYRRMIKSRSNAS